MKKIGMWVFKSVGVLMFVFLLHSEHLLQVFPKIAVLRFLREPPILEPTSQTNTPKGPMVESDNFIQGHRGTGEQA